ncbi:uncharacterized protein Hap1MRO34_005412 [Clarias gariepinus]
MKFFMLLIVFTAMVGFNALCQEMIDSQVKDRSLTADSGHAAKLLDVTRLTRSTKQRGTFCVCAGNAKAQRGCPCKIPDKLSKKEKAKCSKHGIRNYQECKKMLTNINIVTNKGKPKEISTPI